MDQVQDEEHNQLNTTQTKLLFVHSKQCRADAHCHGAPFQTSTKWKLCPPHDYRSSTPYIRIFYHPQTQLQSYFTDNLKPGKTVRCVNFIFSSKTVFFHLSLISNTFWWLSRWGLLVMEVAFVWEEPVGSTRLLERKESEREISELEPGSISAYQPISGGFGHWLLRIRHLRRRRRRRRRRRWDNQLEHGGTCLWHALHLSKWGSRQVHGNDVRVFCNPQFKCNCSFSHRCTKESIPRRF